MGRAPSRLGRIHRRQRCSPSPDNPFWDILPRDTWSGRIVRRGSSRSRRGTFRSARRTRARKPEGAMSWIGRTWRTVAIAGASAAMMLFVWPTPYRYVTYRETVARIHRVTGKADVLLPRGWYRLQPLPPPPRQPASSMPGPIPAGPAARAPTSSPPRDWLREFEAERAGRDSLRR